MLSKIVLSFWFLVICFLFLYSFTQVDLGLTLSQASIIQFFQKSFQYVGYFNRPLSAFFYLSIILILTLLYLWTLALVKRKKIQKRAIWIIIFFTSIILLFSYNAFSYDIFNYMFDARIVTHYGQNPYEHKALDYPGDPMLSFMHWTHRTYPYGPLWLGITIPFSFIGGSFFLLTFYLFKALAVGSYLVSCYLIEKISKKSELINSEFALAFFALNPLVVIESLVSGHNDIAMIALILAGVYFLFDQKKYTAWFFLILSASIKFATALLFPLFIWYPFSKRKNKDLIFYFLCAVLMLLGIVLASERTTFQPWYILLVIPFCSLLSNRYYFLIPSVTISSLALLQYAPFLYLGNFDPPVPMIMNQMLWVSIGISIILTFLYALSRKAKMI